MNPQLVGMNKLVLINVVDMRHDGKILFSNALYYNGMTPSAPWARHFFVNLSRYIPHTTCTRNLAHMSTYAL